MSRSTPIAVAAALVLAGAAGTSFAGPPSKTGSAVTLTLADPEDRTHPESLIAQEFARRVQALSGGSMVVQIVYRVGRTSTDTTNGAVEAKLVSTVRGGT